MTMARTSTQRFFWGSGRIDAAVINATNVTYHDYSSSGTWH